MVITRGPGVCYTTHSFRSIFFSFLLVFTDPYALWYSIYVINHYILSQSKIDWARKKSRIFGKNNFLVSNTLQILRDVYEIENEIEFKKKKKRSWLRCKRDADLWRYRHLWIFLIRFYRVREYIAHDPTASTCKTFQCAMNNWTRNITAEVVLTMSWRVRFEPCEIDEALRIGGSNGAHDFSQTTSIQTYRSRVSSEINRFVMTDDRLRGLNIVVLFNRLLKLCGACEQQKM